MHMPHASAACVCLDGGMHAELSLSFIVSPFLQATCSILAETRPGGAALIIDPGFGVREQVESTLKTLNASPTAIVLTHGHLDHVADAHRVASAWDLPVLIGTGDAYRLEQPIDQLPEAFTTQLRPAWEQHGWKRPEKTRELNATDSLALGEKQLRTLTLPGHTEGSTMVVIDAPVQVNPAPGVMAGAALAEHGVAFTGDVLFRGSIGRTDLPGGDPDQMRTSLEQLRAFAQEHPDMLVVPGHGPVSDFRRELIENRFLNL